MHVHPGVTNSAVIRSHKRRSQCDGITSACASVAVLLQSFLSIELFMEGGGLVCKAVLHRSVMVFMGLISVLHGADFVFGSAANPVTPGGLPILFARLGFGQPPFSRFSSDKRSVSRK
ncbi:hypothetical protein XfCFBP8356_008370 [Xylella fastidiosa subsp. sandyi]|uniref:hypothetical protein n=1 Tax=Xylella fastidiosa TaxID=2371 RepID=UPI000707D191|nr:hypothetical protein [Xylella fastidiosa]KQH73267.1 hypothetical protein AOT81_09535 [Xylella fastidiosa]WNY18066.1 hypothetical protein RO839_05910 [Xylella fastidiosa]WNY20352.1 hypothetical protein RO838_05925 [Xylella fastidiosa]